MTTVEFRPWPIAGDRTPTTYGEVIDAYFDGACRTLALPEDHIVPHARSLTSVLGAWAQAPIESLADYYSWVANNGAPLEFSAAFSAAGVQAFRVLLEVRRQDPTPRAVQAEGHAFTRRLATEFGVYLGRFLEIEDLFLGDRDPAGPFSVMHAVALSAVGEPPLFKMYLNPGVTGRSPAGVTEEALRRLGLADAWAAVVDHFGGADMNAPEHEVALVGLDLTSSADARVKVYLRHTGVGAERIDRAAAVAADHKDGVFAEIIEAIGGGVDATGWEKAPMTCLAFRSRRDVPSSATLYTPLDPNLANDEVSAARVMHLMRMAGVDPGVYETAVSAICGDRRDRLRRLSWVGYKHPADPVCTLYAGLNSPGREPVD
ncbi:tryptophan dimethylallyltransferase family protein [Actinophytocola oryzae]|uniref:DMATS type aromatic prenyltransferase n=1 Tax=Actinophytocola oryzae TaxID=502181 RepID=A0A4R7VJN0_9PSEU|nr:tryptophan dimethylallyltransferase family protein [Actinophytocola oryzae]TDV49663.1 DMATS type aromatic prenyltransferase [Actinophytocola oryzae]